jgi:hypothetical protein
MQFLIVGNRDLPQAPLGMQPLHGVAQMLWQLFANRLPVDGTGSAGGEGTCARKRHVYVHVADVVQRVLNFPPL